MDLQQAWLTSWVANPEALDGATIPAPVWILATGFWADSGMWDDTAVWVD